MNTNETSLDILNAKEAEYRAELRKRSDMIARQYKSKMTQREIAEFWGIDIARVNRILQARKKSKGRD